MGREEAIRNNCEDGLKNVKKVKEKKKNRSGIL